MMKKWQWAGWVCILGVALTAQAYEGVVPGPANPGSPDMTANVSPAADVKPLPEKAGAVVSEEKKAAVPEVVEFKPLPKQDAAVAPEAKKILPAAEAHGWGAESKLTGGGEEDSWFASRLVVGTRVTSYGLKEKERPLDNRYLGSINKIDEDQDYMPVKAFVNYFPVQWGGVGVSYEKISAVTLTEEPGETTYTDGTFTIDGPIFYGVLALPNRTRVTPFVELGMMVPSGSFDANSAWANAHGIQGYQTLDVREVNGGEMWAVGCDIRVNKGWSCNLIYREIKADIVVDHVLLGSLNQSNSNRPFDLSSSFVGGGISYRF
jgi:hypothetical protein